MAFLNYLFAENIFKTDILYQDVQRIYRSSMDKAYLATRRRYHLFYYLLYIINIIQLLMIGYYLQNWSYLDSWDCYLKYDLWISIIRRDHLYYDANIVLFAIGIPVAFILIHWLLYYNPDSGLWNKVYDLTVPNRDQLMECCCQIKGGKILTKFDIAQCVKNPFVFVRNSLLSFFALLNGKIKVKPNKNLRNFQLRHFPALPLLVRARLVAILIFNEVMAKGFQYVVGMLWG